MATVQKSQHTEERHVEEDYDEKVGGRDDAEVAQRQEKKIVLAIESDAPKTFMGIMKYIFDWYPARMSPEEKKLVKKLDFALVGFGAVAFFLKYLDSSNINNAYVSGLKEALNIQKEEYAWFGFFYYIGYMVFQIPTLLYISRPGVARWLLPGVELAWGILTFGQVIIHNVEQVYVIRFFLGALAIPSYTGVNYVLGSWYRGDELFKRSAVFMVGNSLGQMFSGYLQAGAYKGLDGKLGLRGYQWIFIIDAIITIPVAIVGLIFFPGLPSGKRIWWMREDEQLLAQKRMRDDGVATSKKITLKTFTDIFKSWHIYLCTAMITVFLIETYPAGQMTLWLKSVMKADGTPKYSIELINTIPTGIFAIIAVTTFFTGSLAGIWNIWVMLAVIQGVNLFAVTVLRVWTVPDDLKWTAYFMLGFMGAPNPLFFGWINRLTKRNAEERAVVMGSVFCFGWAFFAWIPLVAYKTTEAPRWTKGYSTAIACTIVSTGLFFFGGYLHKREEANRARLGLDDSDDGFGTGQVMDATDAELDEKNRKADYPEHIEGHAVVDESHLTQANRNREAKVLPNPVSTAVA